MVLKQLASLLHDCPGPLFAKLTGRSLKNKLIMLLLPALLFAGPFYVKAGPAFDSLFHQSYAVRSVYFDQVVVPYLDALTDADRRQAFDALLQRAGKERDHAAELELTIGRIQRRDEAGQISLDEKIASLEHLLAGLDREQYPEYCAVVMHYLGQNYYGKKRNYTLAFEHFINAYTIASRLAQKKFPDKQQLLVYLGNRYYTIGDYTKAQQVLLEADSLVHPWDRSMVYNGKNTLGLIYRTWSQYDKAIRCFEQSRTAALADGNKVWAAIASGNTGICYYLQQDYSRAVPLLEEDIKSSFSNAGEAADNGIHSLMILANIHLSRKAFSEVDSYIQLAQRYLDSCRDKMKALSMLYPLMASYYYEKGDYKAAYSYRDLAALYKDSLNSRDHIYKLAQVEYRKDREKAEAKLSRLNAEKKLLFITRNGLIIGLIMLIMITVLIINRQRLRHHLRQVEILSKKVQAEHDLSAATKQLEHFTKHIQEKNLLIEQSGREIEKLRASLDAGYPQEETTEVLQQLYKATILTDEEWHNFKLLFEQVHKGYLQRLREKMPELTPADTRFMVLSKLNLTNKEMAGILGVQSDTIRSYKHRLRKRFNLGEDENIKEFVDSI